MAYLMPETLWSMRGRVKSVKASAATDQIDGFLNRRIANVIESRTWSDSLRIGQLLLPGVYNTGTIALTNLSDQVVGTGVTWPVDDSVNTFLQNVTLDIGYVEDITPDSMANIQVGSILVIESEVPNNMEIVSVVAVGKGAFTAYLRKQHDVNVTIKSSTFSGRQINVDDYVFTIQAVLDPATLVIDQKWGGDSVSLQSYQIIQAYVTVTPFTKRMMYAWDPVQGASLGIDMTWDVLNLSDPQRGSTGDPQQLVSMPPSQVSGVQRWEIWPWQLTPRAINVVTAERWPRLTYDTDLAPWFINSEVFIAGACADALRTRTIPKEGRTDPYYDPDVANSYWEPEYAKLADEARQADEARYMKALVDYTQRAQGFGNPHYIRAHPVPAIDWGE